MFLLHQLAAYDKLERFDGVHRRRRQLTNIGVCRAWTMGRLLILVLIITCMIVTVASAKSTTASQNHTESATARAQSAIRSRGIKHYNRKSEQHSGGGGGSTQRDTSHFERKLKKAELAERNQTKTQTHARTPAKTKTQPLKPPNYRKLKLIKEMRARMLQHEVQQQQQRQQQQQQQHQHHHEHEQQPKQKAYQQEQQQPEQPQNTLNMQQQTHRFHHHYNNNNNNANNQHQHKQQLYHQHLHASATSSTPTTDRSENDYLVERNSDCEHDSSDQLNVDEYERDQAEEAEQQSTYGIWRTKARRLTQPSLVPPISTTSVAATAATYTTFTTASTLAGITTTSTALAFAPATQTTGSIALPTTAANLAGGIKKNTPSASTTTTTTSSTSATTLSSTRGVVTDIVASENTYESDTGNRYADIGVGVRGNGRGSGASTSGTSGIVPNAGYEYQNHLYERVPKRMSTMTPAQVDLSDQIPRPPRLTSRTPSHIVGPASAVLRRQYSDSLLNQTTGRQEEQKPKPFHFPHDGPMPEQFKKAETPPPAEADRSAGGSADVNNIQDILQQMHLGTIGGQAATANATANFYANLYPHAIALAGGNGIIGGPNFQGMLPYNHPAVKMPQMMIMPTGLHIAGTFKNLKSSGITNFFRNKRNKKQVQFTFPMPPLHMPMYQPSPFPYQRIAMDQFYPFKPRSPNDINLLAMHHQQQQQQQQQALASKQRKKKNKQSAVLLSPANTNLQMLQQQQQHGTNQRPYLVDPYLQNYSQLMTMAMAMGAGGAQKSKMKRVPFKVNLDIFPVMPPNKDYSSAGSSNNNNNNNKATNAYTNGDEAKVAPPHSRPPTVLRNPFTDFYGYPLLPSAAAHIHHHSANPNYEAPVMNSPIKFPAAATPAPVPATQSGNSQVSVADQIPIYLHQYPYQQQQQSQQQYHHQQQLQNAQRPPLNLYPSTNHQQSPFVSPIDFLPMGSSSSSAAAAAAAAAAQAAKANQIMVHLNVFPKPSKSANLLSAQSTNPFYSNHYAHSHTPYQRNGIVDPMESRHSDIHSPSTSRHAHNRPISRSDTASLMHPLIDYEQNPPEAAAASASIDNKLDYVGERLHYDDASESNKRTPNAELLIAEAKTAASVFRMPVDNLIQFQVDDAL